jgi:hypothetical protein
VDLRDPSNPRLMQQNWHEITGLNADGAHDVNEYKNGFLVTSPISDDFQILDVRAPLKPKVLSTGNHPQPNDFLFHSGTWPRGGKDEFVIMQGEKNFKPRCDAGEGPVMTYDKSRKRRPDPAGRILPAKRRLDLGGVLDHAQLRLRR